MGLSVLSGPNKSILDDSGSPSGTVRFAHGRFHEFSGGNGNTIKYVQFRMITANALHYIYILRCADEKFYTGMSCNVEQRVKIHNGDTAKVYRPSWTSHRRPVTLVFQHEVCCIQCTRKTEARIKHLSRKAKLELIADPLRFHQQRCEKFDTLERTLVHGGGV